MTFLLRRAVPGDAAALSELGARTFTETFLADNDPADIAAFVAATYATEKQAAELLDPAVTMLVAARNEEPRTLVGFAMLQRGEAPACVVGDEPVQLSRLYVARDHLGLGVGEALMAKCVEDARISGYRTLWLGVWEKNARALRFYRRWGFEVIGSHVFQVGSDPQTDLLLSRAL